MQASSERPRFRQDLVAEPIEDGASRFIDVMDPDSGNLFRFYEVEYALACAMDGERDVGGIVKWAKEELGLTASANEVQTVIATLGELGYLESGAAAAAAAKPETASPDAARDAAAAAAARAPAYNRWDQPTAMGSFDEFMESQVTATKGPGDVELGHAGTHRAAPSGELPKAPDLELGAPGASAVPVREALPKADDLSLGASGRSQASEVSLDLSKHLEVKRDDVKEAVRASQVMQAVEVPPELAAEAEGKAKPAAKEAAKSAAKAEAKPAKAAEAKTAKAAEAKTAKAADAKAADAKPAKEAEAKPAKEAAKAADAKPAKAADAKAADAKTADAKPAKETAKAADAKTADVKPAKETAKAADAKTADAKPAKETAKADPKAKPPVEQPRPVAPPAPRTGVSPVLIFLLVLVILAAGGFAVWKFMLNKPAQETSTTAPPPPPAPPAPVPPPPETAKLETDQPPAVDLKASSAGVVEKIVAGDTAVKSGDTVAWLVGEKPHDTQVKAVQADIAKRLKPELEKAEKEVDAGVLGGKKPSPAAQLRVTKSQKALDDKTAELAKLQAELDKFLVKAPSDGTVAVVAKAQQKITPNDVVAKLTPPAHLVATFKKAGALEVGQHVWLTLKGGDQKLACTVVEASPDQSKIECPHDAATEGAEVLFAGVDTSAPADQGSDAAAGSAQGSAAAAGVEMDQGSDAGSAAAPAPTPAPVPPPVHHAMPRPHHHPHPTPPAEGSAAGGSAAAADKPADSTSAPAPAPSGDTSGSAAPTN